MVATSLIVWPVAPVFLLMHRKDVTISKGTEVTAYISGDVKLDLAKFQPSPPRSCLTTSSCHTISLPASPVATPNAAPTDAPPVSPDQGAAAELDVSSTPDGADIGIDGNFVGSDPQALTQNGRILNFRPGRRFCHSPRRLINRLRLTYRNRSSVIKEGLNKNHCYGDLCFGVFALSVEIRLSAAGGTCVS